MNVETSCYDERRWVIRTSGGGRLWLNSKCLWVPKQSAAHRFRFLAVALNLAGVYGGKVYRLKPKKVASE